MYLIRRKSIFAPSDCSGDLWAVNKLSSVNSHERKSSSNYECGFWVFLSQSAQDKIKIVLAKTDISSKMSNKNTTVSMNRLTVRLRLYYTFFRLFCLSVCCFVHFSFTWSRTWGQPNGKCQFIRIQWFSSLCQTQINLTNWPIAMLRKA